ncbi:MAG TPA: HAD-IC family P-type ATPase, partial [Patescibacteria group bacterium]|nr:HAD-IC family P-type ATPase [Patescibacteria group bacterium]
MAQLETIWHALPVDQVFGQLKSRKEGLSDDEAKLRRIKYGFNQLPRKKKLTKLNILVAQFRSALVYILIIAAVISFFLGEHIDVYVIAAAIFINVLVGFIQENKAQNALEKLSNLVVPEVRVIREGVESKIKARDLVPGDIIDLNTGDRITADARLFEAFELETSEAPLTGESSSVRKVVKALEKGRILAERSNLVYSGTLVSQGRGRAIVIATGLNTEIGKIAGLLQEIEEEATPLQKKLNAFSRHLGLFILFLCITILILGIVTGREFVLMFNTAVAIAVAAIPEGLLVAVTVILALGMQTILKKQALVRKLVAAETLGSTTVICTDKTGTLTVGEMRVAEIITDSSEVDVSGGSQKITGPTLSEAFLVIQIGILCNDAVIPDENLKDWQALGSGTETALLMAGMQVGLKPSLLKKQYPRLAEITFSSDRKYMATLHSQDKLGNLVYFKGAPEKLIESAEYIQQGERKVKIYKDKRKELLAKYEKLSKRGLRVLAFGYKSAPAEQQDLKEDKELFDNLVFVGFAGIKDPLRREVKATLAETARAGIRTVMITGDNRLTAGTIAKELGFKSGDENILEGSDLEKLDDLQLAQKVSEIAIYARVTPKDKLRIVHAWQSRGEVVAMTGDGVNDAP